MDEIKSIDELKKGNYILAKVFEEKYMGKITSIIDTKGKIKSKTIMADVLYSQKGYTDIIINWVEQFFDSKNGSFVILIQDKLGHSICSFIFPNDIKKLTQKEATDEAML
jgi:hypothetical protein